MLLDTFPRICAEPILESSGIPHGHNCLQAVVKKVKMASVTVHMKNQDGVHDGAHKK